MKNAISHDIWQLHEALRRCEERFDLLFNLPAVGIAQLTLSGGWLLVNRKVCEILGYSEEELQRLTMAQLTHPDDRAGEKALLRRLLAEEIPAYCLEKRFIRKGGRELWVSMNVALARTDQEEPDYLIAVLEDITERKRAEEALRQSEETFFKVFKLAPIGITISTLSDGTFLDINEAGERLSGYRREEVIGRSALEFGIWHDADERDTVIAEVLARGEVRDREMVMKEKSGRPFWGLYSGVVIEIGGERYLLSLVSDIGERKKAQEALRESEERFRLLSDSAPVLVWVADCNGRCTFFNQGWLAYTGRSLEDELGDGWTQGVHPEDLQRCQKTWHLALGERRPFSMEYRLRRKDGSYGWIADTGVPRVSGDGEFMGYIGSGFDISELKEAKEALEEANRRLEERVAENAAALRKTVASLQEEFNERNRVSEALQTEISERLNVQAELREKELLLLHQSRLAAMGEMIGNIAHQWRQPLNMLALLVQELPMAVKTGAFNDQYLDGSVRKMLETIRHMSQTIDDFRNFFRPYKEKVHFDLAEVVRTTISLLEGSLKAQQIATTVVVHEAVGAVGFPNEFSQALLNIMINARDAFASQQVADPTIVIEIGSEGGRGVVTVTDNAGGIPEELLDRIFDPYFTTKGPEKGTGVGLFMSRTIIEKNMGGKLTACNEGRGARFRIEL